MSIRKLANDVEFKPSTEIRGKKATISRTVKTDKDAKFRYQMDCVLDFSSCSNDEIVELATRSVWIDVQRMWRELAGSKGSTATTVNPFATVNVKTAIVDAARRTGPRDPKTTAVNALSRMTPEQRAEIMAMFASSIELAKKTA